MGLGLYLVRQIIALHKGTVSVDSQVEKGTTVRISLPISAQTAPPA